MHEDEMPLLNCFVRVKVSNVLAILLSQETKSII